MTLARARFCLAAFLVSITPGAAILFAQLHVSGYTYRDDGSRDLGHLAKALSLDLPHALVTGLVVLAAGLCAVALARRKGARLTAPRLLVRAGGIGVVLGLAASTAVAALQDRHTTSAGRLAGIGGAFAACVFLAALLCMEFVAVAGVPFRADLAGSRSTFLRRLEKLVLVGAVAITAVIIVWLGTLTAYALQHPCQCG
jgi:hypothetical protein